MLVVLAASKRVRKQTGVVPYRIVNGKLQILLIQSSHAGNWTVPKGKKEKDMYKKQSAAVEAFEEAGVSGKLGARLGELEYVKGSTGVQQNLIVYMMRVDREHATYLEEETRTREWFTFKEAYKLLPKRFKPILDELKIQLKM
jgi:8-oxo-dGTP pyrophosphatase MutT (NUDIX family)